MDKQMYRKIMFDLVEQLSEEQKEEVIEVLTKFKQGDKLAIVNQLTIYADRGDPEAQKLVNEMLERKEGLADVTKRRT